MTKFSEELRAWRLDNDLLQQDAAVILDVPYRTYREWELGRQKPSQLGPIRKLLGMISGRSGQKPRKQARHDKRD
jgi:DNA-binding transcriptional regulator YiaG